MGPPRDPFALHTAIEGHGALSLQALKSILPPINQSSGSGLPGSFGVSIDGPITLTQAQIDRMGEMTPAQLKDMKTRGYRIVG